MPELPAGTVTLLFTDIVGSTRLLQELGDGYRDALDEHRRILGAAFDRHGGVVVDLQGDASFAAFPSAAGAVAAAADVIRELAARDRVSVRVGIHSGEPVRTEDSYVGLDVHRAARIAAAAHGGQIVCSQATRVLVADDGFRDLGTHRLKDVGELRLYQVGDHDFPPLRSLNRATLPIPAASLVGREHELDELLHFLANGRLVTVTGPGGIGKTRIVLETARRLADERADGAWFVDLAALRDGALVEGAIAAAVGAAGDLVEHLRSRESLLVLDNFEQVVDAAPLVARILDSCDGISALVTSREPLRLRGEVVYPLQPLEVSAAVKLFRERARAHDPSFVGDTARIAELCVRLDRIPLALELAAARVKLLSLEQLVERLERKLPLLVTGARDAPERQRTLRATIEWSHELLSDEERALFARLAVFAGGWTLDAAEAICDAGLETLELLVDKSLVRVEAGRFGFLETVREYAAERLDEAGLADELRRRHAAYFLELAERSGLDVIGPEQQRRLERLSAERENIHSALAWLAAQPDEASTALRLAASLVLLWFLHGPYVEGAAWLQRLLAATDGERSSARASALWGAGFLLALLGDEERAGSFVEQSLALGRELGDDSSVARSLNMLGLHAFFANEMQRACALLEESSELARRAGDEWCLGDSLGTLASLYPLCGEEERAKELGAQGLALASRAQDPQGVRMALFGLALAAVRGDDPPSARPLAEEGLAICRELGDRWFVSYFLWIVATTSLALGEFVCARAEAEEALEVARALEAPLLIVCALDVLARAEEAHGDTSSARAHFAEAEQLGRTALVPHSYLASVLLGLAELDGDAALAQESLELARGVGDTWAAERAERALSVLG